MLTPSDAAAAAMRSALDGMGGGGGAPGTGRGPPMPGGHPVSISSDLPSGVTNSTAAPPSTSMAMILRSFDGPVRRAKSKRHERERSDASTNRPMEHVSSCVLPEVAGGKGEKCRPVRPINMTIWVLAKPKITIDESGSSCRERRGSKTLLPQ